MSEFASAGGTLRTPAQPTGGHPPAPGGRGRASGTGAVDPETGDGTRPPCGYEQAVVEHSIRFRARGVETARMGRSGGSRPSGARGGELPRDGDGRGAGGAADDPRV